MMATDSEIAAIEETLADTNRLLCIVADTLLDILVAIDDSLADEIIAGRMFAVMEYRRVLDDGEIEKGFER